jgi:hypothetical protein
MAKLRGKAKAAFLRRMARGRAKARRGGRAKSKPRRASTPKEKRPRKKRRSAAQIAATKRMIAANRAKRRGGKKKRRKSASRTTATGGTKTMAKKKKGKSSKRRHHRAKGRRRRSMTITGFRTVRLSNPSLGGMIVPAVAGLAGGAATGLVVAKFLGDRSAGLRALAAVGVSLLGAVMLRKRPQLADAWSGAAVGSIGYGFAVNATGGVVATNKADALALTAKIPDAKTSTPPAGSSSGQQGMGVLLPMRRPGMGGMGMLYNNAAARSLTGMGAANSIRSNINPRVLLG